MRIALRINRTLRQLAHGPVDAANIIALVNSGQNLSTSMQAARLLMVDDAGGSGKDKIAKLSRG